MINALLLNVRKNYGPRFKDTDLFEQIYYCILMKASGLFRGATIVPNINPFGLHRLKRIGKLSCSVSVGKGLGNLLSTN